MSLRFVSAVGEHYVSHPWGPGFNSQTGRVLPNFQIWVKYGSFYYLFLGDVNLRVWAYERVGADDYYHCTVLQVCCRKTVMYCVRTIVTVQYYKSAVGSVCRMRQCMPSPSVCAEYVSTCRIRQWMPNEDCRWIQHSRTRRHVSNEECQHCAVSLTSLCRVIGSVPKLPFSRHWAENVILSYFGDFLHSDTSG
jgi:hypothetical protein